MGVVRIKDVAAQAIRLAVPWDLELELPTRAGGVATYRTVAPGAGQVAGLQNVAGMSNDDAFALFETLFEPPGPPLRELYAAKLLGDFDMQTIIQAICLEVKAQNEKNSEAAARLIREARREKRTAATTAPATTGTVTAAPKLPG